MVLRLTPSGGIGRLATVSFECHYYCRLGRNAGELKKKVREVITQFNGKRRNRFDNVGMLELSGECSASGSHT